MTLVYLDYNASAPVRPEARAAAAEAMDLAANASSVHGRGRQARAVVEDARSAVAEFAGANAERLVFTSGGSEANSLAMAAAIAQGSTRLIIGASEHASVIEAARASGLPVELLPVSAGGVTDLDWLERRLGRWRSLDGPPFAAVMAANNETGIRQPIAQIGALLPSPPPERPPSTSQPLAPTAFPFRRTNLGGSPDRALWPSPQTSRPPGRSMAAARSGAFAAAPRTWSAWPPLGRRRGPPPPRRRRGMARRRSKIGQRRGVAAPLSG
jgi:hypothetical protein